MLDYTLAKEVPNPMNPMGDPLLELGYKGKKGNELCIKYGARKLKAIYDILDKVKEDIDNHDLDEGIFYKTYAFEANSKYPWEETITLKKWSILDHYRAEIKEFIDKYFKPYTPRGAKLISEPKTDVYEDDKCNVKFKLLVPCFAAKEGDEGEGLRAWGVTEYMASFLCRDGENGKCYANIQKALADGKSEYRPVCDYDIALTKEQCEAFVKYYDTFLKFVINPQSI